jgi:hypothetical protein
VNPSIAAEREALKADIRKKIKRPESTVEFESIGDLSN